MFKLLRSFAVTGAAALIAVAALLYVLYRHTAVEDLLHDAEQRNIVLAQSLGNAIWMHHAEHIDETSRADPARLNELNEATHLDEEIKRLSVGLPVLEISIFNADGSVIYSTNPDEVGADTDHHARLFDSARQGNTSSQILYRNDPYIAGSELSGRDVVETLLPLRDPGGEVRGVLELCSDVTDRLGDIRQMSGVLLGGLLAGFAMLYGGFLPAARRTERVVRSQHETLQESRERLIEKNRELEAEIARRAEIEAELREAHDEARAASRAKSQFLANMSHELRTPLNAVIGFSQVMVDEALGRVSPPRYREYAQDIRDSGRHLLALVNNVLDLAKIESGRMDVSMAPFEVRRVVRDSVRGVKAELANNGNTLRLDCPRDLGTMVSDEIKVRGVLTNLIGNATKFTSNGRIEIEARWENDGGDGIAYVVFRVSDTGIGMDSRRIEEMFGEFTQHDNSITREFGGTGLGLAICRRVCEALGGGIVIDSAPGQGTTVTVRLPDKRRIEDVEYRPEPRRTANPSAA